MSSKRWPRILASLASIVITSACAVAQPTAAMPTPPPTLAPEPAVIIDPTGMAPGEVAKTFYTWYIESWHSPDRAQLAPNAYEQTGYLTDELVQKLDRTREEMESSGSGGVDLILCAQDIPQHVRVEQVDAQGEQATVLLSSSFEGHRLEIDLQQIGGIWKIAGIRCGVGSSEASATESAQPTEIASSAGSASPIESATPTAASTSTPLERPEFANWRIYQNAAFGIQIAYPPDWVYEELITDPNKPPIGAANVQMVVLFQPQEWELSTPFILELTEGSWEEYRGSYIEPAKTEALELNDYPALFELEQVTDEITILRYLIENPTDSDWRVTFVDSIAGFPERVQGNEEYVELFQQMMQTFEFIR